MRFISILVMLAALAGVTLADVEEAEERRPTTGMIQTVIYIKRNPNFKREKFYKHWEKEHTPLLLPLTDYFNITRYQQIHVGGMIVPTKAGASGPAMAKLIEFDGIAIFLHETPDVLQAMFSHPYYIHEVAPNEQKFIDTEAFNSGMIATFAGPQIEVIEDSKNVWEGKKSKHRKYQKLFQRYVHDSQSDHDRKAHSGYKYIFPDDEKEDIWGEEYRGKKGGGKKKMVE